ncbi:von Willebrand factor A domain-containing protein 3B-like [Arapaima gigas]
MADPLPDHGEVQQASADQEVKALISSTAWLKVHGLKGNHLSFPQILGQISFRHKEDYVPSLQKSVSSKYAGDLFPQFVADGAVYNLTAHAQQLEELCARLDQQVDLYRQRMTWLTTGSRQLFGVIQERSTSLVLDLGRTSRAQFYLSQDSVCKVIREQVSQIAWFNLVSCAPRVQAWQEKAVYTTPSHIEAAVQWVKALQPAPSSPAHVVDAVLTAVQDSEVEAVYLFAVGDFDGREAELLTAVKNPSLPIHCVSFNAKRKETIQTLRELSQLTAGRQVVEQITDIMFHAFAEIPPTEDASHDSGGGQGTEGRPEGSLKAIGGVPPGVGVREDIFLVWREMEEARITRAQIEALLLELPSQSPYPGLQTPVSEDYISSREWLSLYGLNAQRLLLHDALADCAFRHSDGLVDVRAIPEGGGVMADAESRRKLVNAKYCNRFVHMSWKDGSIVHVYITARKCRWYEDRMKLTLAKLQRRLEWLQRGSREVFGTILEEKVYFLIDTSESMNDQLSLVKCKLHQLIQEQLYCKAKVNFVTLGCHVASWRLKMADVMEESLESTWHWVQGLEGGGSAQIFEALRLALADTGTHAVYLLTNSLPDQPLGSMLAHVQRDPLIPIHTISFSCSDPDAERFLFDLSKATGGRYHSYLPCTLNAGQHLPYASEDVHLLKEEIERGKRDLKKVLKLRAECVVLDWYHNRDNKTAEKNCLRRPHSASQVEGSAQQVAGIQRPQSAAQCVPNPWDGDQQLGMQTTHLATQTASTPACTAASLRYLLNYTDEQVLCDWMMPETLSLFQANIEKQHQVLHSPNLTLGDADQKKHHRQKPQLDLDVPTARWLQTNSLVSRRLTIMDIVAPAAISQKSKYIPILDKNICSKVFKEVRVFSFTHTNNDFHQLTLINPLAVDFEGYKTKLQKVLKIYERRLNLLVWRVLTQEEKDKFASDKPVAFRENREAMLLALERLGWPLPWEDLDLLEDQICMGLSFLQQASDLQQAIRQKIQNSHTKQGVNSTLPKAPEKKLKQVLDTLRGQRVIARSKKDGFYYEGTVRRCIKGKKVMVDFSSGDFQIISLRFLITVGGAGPCPPLAIGDFAFVSTGKQAAVDCFVPGVVIATPHRLEPTDKLYTVYKYNSKMVHVMRNKIIKVSQKRYLFTCRYIREQHEKEQVITPEVDPVTQKGCGTTGSLAPQQAKGTETYRAQGRPRSTHLRSSTNQASEADEPGRQ